MLIALSFETIFCYLNRDHHLQNVEIIVADISSFEMEASYDRIYSIEMFEVNCFCCQYVLLHRVTVDSWKLN